MARSVWIVAPRQVEVRSEEVPNPGPGEVRVESIASAISHGTEMLVLRGQVPRGLQLDLPTLEGSFAFPIKYGYASTGRVVEVGASVSRFSVGDTVFVHHPHQSEYVVPESMPIRLPPAVSPVRGIFLANIETAVNAVLDAAPRIGERVVIFGQGIVGLLITQLLRRSGVAAIDVVDPLAHRREVALRVGADVASATPLGQEYDLAIEVSGQPAALDQAIDRVAFGGTILVCSWYGTKPVQLNLGGSFHRRRLRIVSSQVSTIDSALQPRWTRERRMSVALRLLPELDIESLISHRFSVEQAPDAYRLVDGHPEDTLQVVFTYP